jgi:hypothetical protein
MISSHVCERVYHFRLNFILLPYLGCTASEYEVITVSANEAIYTEVFSVQYSQIQVLRSMLNTPVTDPMQ